LVFPGCTECGYCLGSGWKMDSISELQQAAEPKNERYDSTELQKEAGVTDLDSKAASL